MCSHVGYVQFVIITVTPVVSSLFCVSVATHVTACAVHVTGQMNCTIMRHSLHKSTTIMKGMIPIHSETTARDMKDANVAVSESLFKRNMMFPLKVTRISRMTVGEPFSLCCLQIVDQTVVMRFSWAAKVEIESKRIVLKFPCVIKLKGAKFVYNDCVSLFFS